MSKTNKAVPSAMSAAPIDEVIGGATDDVRSFSFSGVRATKYPDGGGDWHIRAMKPTERREWFELLGKKKVEHDPATGEILRDLNGNPLREPDVDEDDFVNFAARFVVRVEKVFVDDRRLTITMPVLKESDAGQVLRYPGLSKDFVVEVDEAGRVLTEKDKKTPIQCPKCSTVIAGRKAVRKETRYTREELWYWIIRTALAKLEEDNKAKVSELGNS